MYFISLFGALMVLLSIIMVVSPEYWSKGIMKFSEKPFFHPFEIVSRLLFGVVLVVFADQTLYPIFMSFLGYVLVLVGVGLAFTPPSRHRQFAVWSAQKFKEMFRPAGIGSLLFGTFIIYAAVQGPGGN